MILALCWSFGLLFGFCPHAQAELDVSWMRGLRYRAVSIVSLLRVILLPFLLSAFAVLLSAPALRLPVCFCKAYLHGYADYSVFRAVAMVGVPSTVSFCFLIDICSGILLTLAPFRDTVTNQNVASF